MTTITDSAVADLRSAVSGPVYRRGEEGFAEEVSGFNLMSPNDPDLVVGAESEADVVAAVKWAVENGTTVHPQATGHGAYRDLDHGLLLKTNRLDHITVDAEIATWTMGSGLRWMQILPHLHAAGLGAVTGSSKTVGAVGLTMGGGIGPLGRTLGMAGDWIRGYRVVNGSGEVLVVNPDSHPDLFWALRGGKVGLGVVTEVTFEAPRMPFVYAGGMFFAEDQIDRLFHSWYDWIQDLPESVNTSIAILRLPPDLPEPLGGRTVFHLRYAYVEVGATNEQLESRGEALLASWRDLAGAPVLDTIGILPSDRVGEIHAEPEGPLPIWEWGDFLRDIDHEFIDVILKHVGGGVQAPLATLEVRFHGGAIARDPEYPSAIGGRKEPFTLLALGVPIPEINPWDVIESAGYAIRDDVAGWSGAEVNYNWANHPSKEIFEQRLWSGDTGARLREIRRRYDPVGIFEHGN